MGYAYHPPAVPTPDPGLQVFLSPLGNAQVGTAYTAALGDVYYRGAKINQHAIWELIGGTLPVGSTVSLSGTLSTTLVADGAHYVSLKVTVLAGSVGNTYELVASKSSLLLGVSSDGGAGRIINVALANIPNAQVNVVYATSLGSASVTGTSPPTPTWSIASAGNLPSGYSLSSTGLLTATFTVAESVSFVVKVSANGAAPVEHGITLSAVATGGGTGNPTAPGAPPVTLPSPPAPVFDTVAETGTQLLLVTHVLTDDGLGSLTITQDDTGVVAYDTGVLYFPPEIFFSSNTWSSSRDNGTGEWKSETISDVFANGALITVSYRPDSVVPTTASETLPAQNIVIDLVPYTANSIVPGTVRFSIGSTIYEDFEGVISHTVSDITGVGTPAGTIDYGTGQVILTDWVTGSSAFSLLSLATFRGQFIDTQYDFRTLSSPLKPSGFQVAVTALDGALLTGAADSVGVITGDAMLGHVDVEYGRVQLAFGESVLDSSLTPEEKLEEWYDVANISGGYIWQPRKIIPQTGRYNTTVYSYLPLSANLLGLDPVRLPMDGRVPTCRAGDSAILHFTDTLVLVDVIANSVHDLAQTFLARVWIKDANNLTVVGEKYTANLDTGIITFAADLNLSTYTLPLTAHFMIADEALVTDVDVSGMVMFGRSILHDFPLGSYLSTEIRIGDMGGRVTVPFAQGSWSSVWSDVLIGTATTAKFANNLYPIVTTNDGAVQERWRMQFVSSSTINVIGETLGQLNLNPLSILEVIAPINPVTSTPYFTIPIEGWGAGWISGNLLRFNTIAADYPIDVLRCVKMGPATGQPDRIGLEFLGDVDA